MVLELGLRGFFGRFFGISFLQSKVYFLQEFTSFSKNFFLMATRVSTEFSQLAVNPFIREKYEFWK